MTEIEANIVLNLRHLVESHILQSFATKHFYLLLLGVSRLKLFVNY